VQAAPHQRVEVRVERLADLVVAEAVRGTAPARHQLPLGRLGQRGSGVLKGAATQGGYVVQHHAPAEHGGGAEDHLRLAREPPEPVADRLAQLDGDRKPAGRLRQVQPGAARYQPAPLGEGARDLLDEKRVALALAVDQSGQARRDRGFEQPGEQRGRGRLVESAEVERRGQPQAVQLDEGVLEHGIRPELRPAVGRHDEQARVAQSAPQVEQQLEAGRVGPMEVVEQDEEWSAARQGPGELGPGFEEGRPVFRTGRRAGRAQLREQVEQPAGSRAELAPSRRLTHVVDVAAERFGERLVRRKPLPFVGGALENAPAGPRGLGSELEQQPALADARLAVDHRELRLRAAGQVEQRAEQPHLGVAAGKRCAADREQPTRPGRRNVGGRRCTTRRHLARIVPAGR
jgi:hypothetical protein